MGKDEKRNGTGTLRIITVIGAVGLIAVGFIARMAGTDKKITATPITVLMATAMPTATPFETATSLPTVTPTPIATFLPTVTTVPTTVLAEPTSNLCPPILLSGGEFDKVQERTALLIPGAKVTWYDDFSCDRLHSDWAVKVTAAKTSSDVAEGVFKIQVVTEVVQDSWVALVRSHYTVSDHTGVLVLLKYGEDTSGTTSINAGTWDTQDNKQWGIGNNLPGKYDFRFVYRSGKDFVPTAKVFRFAPDTWYYVLIVKEAGGGVSGKIWERDHPNKSQQARIDMGANWSGLDWIFISGVREGKLEIDEYVEFEQEG